MTAEGLGGRLLGEVEVGSLESVLGDLRKLYAKEIDSTPRRLGNLDLDSIWNKHGGKLEVTGRALPLLYHIISTAVSTPRLGTVAVVDVDGRFDVSRLDCSMDDLKHVHIFKPVRDAVKVTVDSIEPYLVYGSHSSQGRDLVAVMVIGGVGGDVLVGWRGWLKAESEKEQVVRFGMGMSVEEALREREARQNALDEKGWTAQSEWGSYKWVEDKI